MFSIGEHSVTFGCTLYVNLATLIWYDEKFYAHDLSFIIVVNLLIIYVNATILFIVLMRQDGVNIKSVSALNFMIARSTSCRRWRKIEIEVKKVSNNATYE